MAIEVRWLPAGFADDAIEIVERKGLGHPDSICDALAERLSLELSRAYLERFGAIAHHNVDKALLWAGSARPHFGGGEVVAPMEIFLAGRATRALGGREVPIDELAVEGSRAWLRENLHALDAQAHVVIHPLVRPGSADLAELHARGRGAGGALANDTSCGVGFAPLSDLERTVDAVERALNRPETKRAEPAIGEDVKVMGVRRGREIHLTVGCALIGGHLESLDAYLEQKKRIAERAREAARAATQLPVHVDVNAADAPAAGSVYLTVTGTSAEAGDDGQAGRGNRANGLITPGRPMTMESVAGKNPINHVGKLYNVLAGLISHAVAGELAVEAECFLVSQIGRPIREPRLCLLRLRGAAPEDARVTRRAREIAGDQLSSIDTLWQDLVAGRVALDRWPLRV